MSDPQDSQDWDAKLAKIQEEVNQYGHDLAHHGYEIASLQLDLTMTNYFLVQLPESLVDLRSIVDELKDDIIHMEDLLDGYASVLGTKAQPKGDGKIKRDNHEAS